MDKQKTIIINGREYDALTGLPTGKAQPRVTRQSLRSTTLQQQTTTPKEPTRHAASTVHAKTQRSRTLNRKFVQKSHAQTSNSVATPNSQPVAVKAVHPIKTHPSKRIDGIRSAPNLTGSTARANISAAKLNASKRVQLQPTPTIPAAPAKPAQPAAIQPAPAPIPHPAVTRAHTVQAQKKAAPHVQTLPTASVLKQAAINEAMEKAPKHSAKQLKKTSRRSKLLSFASAFSALVLFAGYLTYLNVPNLSVRVAAAQAGIDASYPGYRPDGYKLNGPVAYSDGEVRMQFAANTGSNEFTLSQARSNWDSNALLENYVKDKSEGNYITSQERGITVYSYDGKAAWVSGGILYTIDGDAPLSPQQIRKIATSV